MKHTWEVDDIKPGLLVQTQDTDFLIGAYKNSDKSLVYCLVGYYSGVIHRFETPLRLAQKLTQINARPL